MRNKWWYVVWGLGGLLALAVLLNAAMWIAYRGKVLPNVSLGPVQVGSMQYNELSEKLSVDELLLDQVELAALDKQENLTPTDLGVTVDWPATQKQLQKQRTLFPLANLVVHRTVPVELTIDDHIFDEKQAELAKLFHKNPQPERVVFRGDNFEVGAPEAGYQLDGQQFKSQILSGIETGKSSIQVPIQEIPALEMTGAVPEAVEALRRKLQVPIKLSLKGATIQPSRADIGNWFVQDGSTMSLSMERVAGYINSLGSIYNVRSSAWAIRHTLDTGTETTLVLVTSAAPKKISYCAETKGVDTANLPGFVAKTAAVLGDPRGWNVGGDVGFEWVESSCDFSLWLSASSQMTSFGGLCDSYYSCRSGRNVVINYDRWRGATDPWNAAGGKLEDYRVMVTNHEVGHWLGFAHRYCAGPGQPAPVMQQQSIDLQGCTFNPWPDRLELEAVTRKYSALVPPKRDEDVALGSCCTCGRCVS